jgi:hypothetical protein
MKEKSLKMIASVCLAIGGIFGMAGTFVQSATLRGLAWGVDGTALVVAAVILTLYYYRKGQDLVASGFLVFAMGEGILLTTTAMDLQASGPIFGAGLSLWAAGLILISTPKVFPIFVRVLGTIASILFFVTAFEIFYGKPLQPLSTPLPHFGYPVLVATFIGWIWTLLKTRKE